MDFSQPFSQPAQRLSLGGLPSNYGSAESSISKDDQSLFQGLSQIGIPFDAFNPFSLQDPFFSPQNEQQQQQQQQQQSQQLQQPTHAQQQQQHEQMTSQALQAPKSLSPESSNDDSQMQYEHSGMGNHTANHMVGVQSIESDHAHRSSEEKDPNSMPAQDKRKAQNRAAQRAFRERKMVHVQKLEDQVLKLKDASKGLQSDNERLKRELAALSTQNEILRATHVRPSGSSQHMHQPQQLPRPASPTLGPQTFTPTEFVVATGGEARLPLQFDVYPNSRGRMLLAGAAWDLIQRDKRVQMGQVDLEEVCRKLKGRAICDGRGPAFREDEVRKILNDCSKKGMNDDLL